jgi:hypothetical protein
MKKNYILLVNWGANPTPHNFSFGLLSTFHIRTNFFYKKYSSIIWVILFFENSALSSFSEEESKNLQLIYRISLILVVLGAVILFSGIFGFGSEIGEFDDLDFIGGLLVLVGLVGFPFFAWLWMFKKEKNL